MVKLAKYIKPFLALIIASIVLLFIQAMSDLALPDYMSNIVNNGIQQGGIVNAVPEAIRQSEMDKLQLFMREEEQEEIADNYTLVDQFSTDYQQFVKDYPILTDEAVYILNSIDESDIDTLNSIMAKSFLAVSGIEMMKSEAQDGMINFNGMEIPADTDLFAMMAMLPSEQLSQIMDMMHDQLSAMDESMIEQTAIASVKTEYEVMGMDMHKIQSDYILHTGVLMLLISLLSGACAITVGLLASRAAAGFARDVRKSIFKKVESFSKAQFDQFSTASLITRTTNDITQIQMLVVILIRMVFYAPIMGVGGVIRAIGKSSSMSWIIALAVILLLCLIITVFRIAMPKFEKIQKLVDRLNLVTRENLSGMMVIRAFSTQKFEEKRFENANEDLTSTNLFVNRVMVSMFPIMMFIMNGITLLIVWVGAKQIAESAMQVGDMMAFMQYAMQIIFSFLMMSMVFIMIPRASVSARRIAEVLEKDPVIIDPENPKKFRENEKGIIEFKNVSFKYTEAEEDLLKNISFKAMPGETTAFIGSTGSGKTTLINLIPRFYDVTQGHVLVDGIDVRDVTQHDLRNKIGYVPQKSALFSGSIESNIKYADENATEEDIEKAAEIAQAMEFINENPERFQGEISQGGVNVSGGQKQRLSIARALVKKPEIYIFDDSFSALDFKTDATLRKALKEQIDMSTILIVAQRISTIINADQIIVLDEGKIVGKGTHKELMENCSVYREIALSQLSKEELK
ncbi:MAG: ABC transporter ATP-binding protein [Eubacteriales bacterium]